MKVTSYRIEPKDLAVTTIEGATRKEAQYSAERRHFWLKAKYRPKRSSHPQWGTGGDHTGKKQVKGTRRTSTPGPEVKKVLVVGPTGRRSFQVEHP